MAAMTILLLGLGAGFGAGFDGGDGVWDCGVLGSVLVCLGAAMVWSWRSGCGRLRGLFILAGWRGGMGGGGMGVVVLGIGMISSGVVGVVV